MISVPVVESGHAGAARRRAVQAARAAGFGEEECDRLAIVVTELATNLLRHAVKGEILLAAGEPARQSGITVIALDEGAGIADVHVALQDGYTTADGGPKGIGGGLGAIQRMSDAFDIYSDQQGTTVVARLAATRRPSPHPGELETAGLIVPKPGFDDSGDAYAVRRDRDATVAMLVDVLGHGPVAATEAKKSVEAFHAAAGTTLEETKQRVGDALSGGRGAAAMIVSLPGGGDTLQATGLGNVRGEIVSPDGTRRGIPLAPGIMGATAKRPLLSEHEWLPGATLILSTDGLRTAERSPLPAALFSRDPLTIAATAYKRRRRGNDDSGVVIARCAP